MVDRPKVMVSDETKVKVLAQLESEFRGEEDFQDTWKKVEALAKQGTVGSIVESCMGAAWDLESFVNWVMESIENHDDAKNLLGEAVFRSSEWDT